MQTEFTPLLSFAGGAIIGIAAVLLMAFSGKIAGVSGIVARLLPPSWNRDDFPASLAFVIGLLLAIPLYQWATGTLPEAAMVAGTLMLPIAGFLTGFGASLGNGCTSGHGVCGLSRLSARSMVATGTFMLTAFITVYVLRHVIGGAA
jgi:uncharacterized membrane protein YedE/YeeE